MQSEIRVRGRASGAVFGAGHVPVPAQDQRLFAIERYISRDVFNRIVLDIGKSIQDNAPSASAGLSRLKEISDYVRETVAGRFRSLRKAGEQLDARRVSQLVNQALQEAFSVFEDYVT